MRKYLLSVAMALIAAFANAATWERPAGGYTPTNHSINTTKYQTDSANHINISSAKLDGDVNKAFQGLNDIEARTPPSVVGQAGKFLTNNGANSAWGLVSTSAIDSGASPAGYVLKANGVSGTAFGLLDASSFPETVSASTYVLPTMTVNAAGFITSVTSTPSVTAFNAIKQPATVSSSGVIPLRVGSIIQSAIDSTSAVINLTPAIPADNSIPQQNEGIQFLAATITPTSASNMLRVRLTVQYNESGGSGVVFALFKDSNANASKATFVTTGVAGGHNHSAVIEYQELAGTTSPTVIKARGGGTNVGLNATSGGATLGGSMNSMLVVEEIQQ